MYDIKEFVFDKISKEDYFIVMGSDDMIDEFSGTFGVEVNILMEVFSGKDNKFKSEPIRIFNDDTKEILMFGLAKKKDIKNFVPAMKKSGLKKEDIKDITAIMLQKGYHIFTYQTKSDKEKIELVDKIFKIANDERSSKMKEVMDNLKRKRDDELYKGYV